jgi:hypothetical protein
MQDLKSMEHLSIEKLLGANQQTGLKIDLVDAEVTPNC